MAPSLHVVSPCEGLAGLVLALTEDGHHRDESLVGLDVRVRLQTLQERDSDQEADERRGRAEGARPGEFNSQGDKQTRLPLCQLLRSRHRYDSA